MWRQQYPQAGVGRGTLSLLHTESSLGLSYYGNRLCEAEQVGSTWGAGFLQPETPFHALSHPAPKEH